MPRRPSLTAAARAAASTSLALISLVLAGCGFGPVSVEPYDVGPEAADTCEALLDDLPEVVGNAIRREVEPASLPAAAWGQPAIVLRCGVGMPAAYRPDTQLLGIDDVGWFAEEGQGGMFFTATDREVLVEVAVPDDYAPAVSVLQDLTPVVAEHVPERPLP